MGVAAIPGIVAYLYSKTALIQYVIIHGIGIAVTAALIFLFYHDTASNGEGEKKQKS